MQVPGGASPVWGAAIRTFHCIGTFPAQKNSVSYLVAYPGSYLTLITSGTMLSEELRVGVTALSYKKHFVRGVYLMFQNNNVYLGPFKTAIKLECDSHQSALPSHTCGKPGLQFYPESIRVLQSAH